MAKKRGRPPLKPSKPSKLTPEVSKKICDLIKIGAPLETAAIAVGITRDCLMKWLQAGRRGARKVAYNNGKRRTERNLPLEVLTPREELCLAFTEAVHLAAAQSEINDIKRIDGAADSIWQAAAWKLERRYPQRWAKPADAVIHNTQVNQTQVNATTTIQLDNQQRLVRLSKILSLLDAGPAGAIAAEADAGAADGVGQLAPGVDAAALGAPARPAE